MSAPLLAPRLLDVPMAGLYPVDVDEANRLVVHWQHDLGPCNRPFHQEAFALELDARPVAVAISASIINGPIRCKHGSYERAQTVELARLAGEPWANRVMLRLWREAAAPRWPGSIDLGVSYSRNAKHRGDLYRFDGWEKVREDAGAGKKPSVWGRRRGDEDYAAAGPKTLWVWHYDAIRGEAA